MIIKTVLLTMPTVWRLYFTCVLDNDNSRCHLPTLVYTTCRIAEESRDVFYSLFANRSPYYWLTEIESIDVNDVGVATDSPISIVAAIQIVDELMAKVDNC